MARHPLGGHDGMAHHVEEAAVAGTLTALAFATPDGADAVLDDVKRLSTRNLIKLQDAAVVSWPEGKRRPRTSQLHDVTGPYALGGSFWGLLIGLLFAVPLLGALAGAAVGAVAADRMSALSGLGIDREFMERIRAQVTPGTSALFLLTSDAVRDEVFAELGRHDFEIVATNLSDEEEQRLRDAFADD